jgi:hypothetical protein
MGSRELRIAPKVALLWDPPGRTSFGYFRLEYHRLLDNHLVCQFYTESLAADFRFTTFHNMLRRELFDDRPAR